MTNEDVGFDEWTDIIKAEVLQKTGRNFRDVTSIEADYDIGRDAYDVADEIIAEYLADE